jgi:hypothetical protein
VGRVGGEEGWGRGWGMEREMGEVMVTGAGVERVKVGGRVG